MGNINNVTESNFDRETLKVILNADNNSDRKDEKKKSQLSSPNIVTIHPISKGNL